MLLRLNGHSEVGGPRGINGGGDNGTGGGGGRGPVAHGLMAGLRVVLILTLLVLADSQRWPINGTCDPCQCYYKISTFGRLRHVNCSQRGLRAVPDGLPSDLMALDLSWNPLDVDALRQQLCKFKSLQSLSLTFSDLTTLSGIFGECSSVLELNLTGNRLAQLDSATFQGLHNLRRLLGLEAEAIKSKEVFTRLGNLRDLDLVFHGDALPDGIFHNMSMNSVNLVLTSATFLPKGIFSFGTKTLNTIQLVGEKVEVLDRDLLQDLYVLRRLFLIMPQVSVLPATLFQSQQQPVDTIKPANLQEVEITGVKSIPANLFSQVDNIESLRLKDIGSFPRTGFLAGLINLRTLVITGSRIESIPAGWFKELYSVKTLQLSNLQLEKLDDEAFEGLLNLNYLDLSYNVLPAISGKTLKPLAQTLESLILTGNMLSELSEDCLRGLYSLRYLDVSENSLSTVYANAFGGMTRLSVLYLTSNRLTSLPHDLFKDQLQLESLSLTDNYFVEFPRAVLELRHSLVTLELSYNKIRGLPSVKLCQFAYLERINIIQNPLHCDCSLLAIQRCQNISVDGTCQTPRSSYGKSLQMLEVPESCRRTHSATPTASNNRTTQPGTTGTNRLFQTPQEVLPNQTYKTSDKSSENKTPATQPASEGTKQRANSPNLKSTFAEKEESSPVAISQNSSRSDEDLMPQNTVVRELFEDNENVSHIPLPVNSSRPANKIAETGGDERSNKTLLENVDNDNTLKDQEKMNDHKAEDNKITRASKAKKILQSKQNIDSKHSSKKATYVGTNTKPTGNNISKEAQTTEDKVDENKLEQANSQTTPEQISAQSKAVTVPVPAGVSQVQVSNTRTPKGPMVEGTASFKNIETTTSAPALVQRTEPGKLRTITPPPSIPKQKTFPSGPFKDNDGRASTDDSKARNRLIEDENWPAQYSSRINNATFSKVHGGQETAGSPLSQDLPAMSTSAPVTTLENRPARVNAKNIPLPGKLPTESGLNNGLRGDGKNGNKLLAKNTTADTMENGSDNNTASPVDPALAEDINSQNVQSIQSIEEAELNRKIVSKDGVDNAEDGDESMAFNFTIGALAAVLVFGGLVMSVYGIRRCQRQGTYIITGRDEGPAHETELHSMDNSPDLETPPFEYTSNVQTTPDTK